MFLNSHGNEEGRLDYLLFRRSDEQSSFTSSRTLSQLTYFIFFIINRYSCLIMESVCSHSCVIFARCLRLVLSSTRSKQTRTIIFKCNFANSGREAFIIFLRVFFRIADRIQRKGCEPVGKKYVCHVQLCAFTRLLDRL